LLQELLTEMLRVLPGIQDHRPFATLIHQRRGNSDNPLENRREYTVPEFNTHPTTGYKVPVNTGSTPGASDDGRNHFRAMIQIKPPTGYGESIRVQFSGTIN